MSRFQSFFANAARHLNAHVGEDVVYTPRGGSARTVKGLVRRTPHAPDGGPVITIDVADHATEGIEPDDTGLIGGSIAVAIRLGQTAATFVIEQPNPVEQDAGMVRIALFRTR